MRASTGVQVIDRAMTEFRGAYYAKLQEFNLRQGTDFTMRTPAPTYYGDNWFIMKSPSLPEWADLRHMAINGCVEISFKETEFSKVAAIGELLEAGMALIQTGKYKQHVTIRLPIPQIRAFDSFERVQPQVESALLGAERLWRLYLRNRARFDAVLVPARPA